MFYNLQTFFFKKKNIQTTALVMSEWNKSHQITAFNDPDSLFLTHHFVLKKHKGKMKLNAEALGHGSSIL